jgi:hypothetical protein
MDTMILAQLYWAAYRVRERDNPTPVVYGSHHVSSIKSSRRKVLISVSELGTMELKRFLKLLERKNPAYKVFIKHEGKTYKLRRAELREKEFHLVHEVTS